MTKLTENLQAVADAWSEKLKLPVQINLLVQTSAPPVWGAYIGHMGCVFSWHAVDKDLMTAQAEAERHWKLDGAPTDPKNAERAKIKARAEELGFTLIDNNQPKEVCQ